MEDFTTVTVYFKTAEHAAAFHRAALTHSLDEFGIIETEIY